MELFTAAVLISQLPLLVVAVCPPGYIETTYTCYKYHSAINKWWLARNICQRNHGDLISLDSWDKFQYFRQLMKPTGARIWVGAHDALGYRWVNGKTEPIQWGSNEPSRGGESCVEMYPEKDYYLNDDECYNWKPYICEIKECTAIDHCIRLSCTSLPDDSYCDLCEDHAYFFKLNARKNLCHRMCSLNGHYCWPGECGDGIVNNCSCSDGFTRVTSASETSCQLTKTPSLETCLTTSYSQAGEQKTSPAIGPTNECKYQTDFYGNFQPVKFYYNLMATFHVNASHFPKQPSYIHSYNFGITDIRIDTFQRTVTGNEALIKTTAVLTDTDSNSDAISEYYKDGYVDIMADQLNDGDSLCLKYIVKGGGFLRSIDRRPINHVVSSPKPYSKTESSKVVCFRYDLSSPRHCRETESCSDEPLHLEVRITKTPNILVEFEGWNDPIPAFGLTDHASSIQSYMITVNEVSESNRTLKVDILKKAKFKKTADATESSVLLNISTTMPTLFCVTLEVKDVADNIRQARRFFLFDNSSVITSREDKPFYIKSASETTNYIWQTHHNDICLDWKDHFLNQYYHDNPLLNPIEPDPNGLISGVYDQISGVLPISGTPNVYGILKFMVAVAKGNATFASEVEIPDFLSQTFCANYNYSDGDTYHFKVRAVDIVNNSYSEIRTVHIDRSVPQITNIWLEKDGYERIFVHDNTDLSTMNLKFDAYDPHSGIRIVEWLFGTSASADSVMESGALAVMKVAKENCSASGDCYCPSVGDDCEELRYSIPLFKLRTENKHNGDHNRNYFFTIKVINNAHLSSEEQIDILVDDSPPETGVVFEGPEDSPDLDYTSDSTFLVHWHGFIDHESGIKLYRLGLADRCLTASDFEQYNEIIYNLTVKDVDASENTARLYANFTGKQYVTVVALNNAMEMSKPACSDGIIKDISPPTFQNVTLANGNWAASLICREETTWRLLSDMIKVEIPESKACQHVCTKSQTFALIESVPAITETPVKTLSNSMSMIGNMNISEENPNDVFEFICSNFPIYDAGNLIYIPNDQVLLQWDVQEEYSQITDYYIGFGIDASEKQAPSLLNYVSTAKKSIFNLHHVGISAEKQFFIFLKGVNKAGLETILPIGPVLIDQTPPRFKRVPSVIIDEDDIIVGWENDTFYDDEQTSPMRRIFFQIGHQDMMMTPLMEWHQETAKGCPAYSGGCFRYPLAKLQRQDTNLGLSFHFILHVYNNAGHYLTLHTNDFKLPSIYPPSPANIIDTDPAEEIPGNTTDIKRKDIDAHFSDHTVCIIWNGINEYRELTVEIGIGSVSKTDNIYAFEIVNNTGFNCLTSHMILHEIKLFVSIRVTNSGGSTISSSNGVVIYNTDQILNNLQVFNGPECFTSNHLVEKLNFERRIYTEETFTFPRSFIVGKVYTVRFVSINQSDVRLVVQSPDIVTDYTKTNDEHFDVIFQSLNTFPEFKFGSLLDEPVYLKEVMLYDCREEKETQTDPHKIVAHWSGLTNYFTYRFTVISIHCNDTRSEKCVQYEKPDEISKETFVIISDLNLRPGLNYSVAVMPCLNSVCLHQKTSLPFTMEPDTKSLNILRSEIIIGTHNSTRIKIQWQPIEGIRIRFYQWSLSAWTGNTNASYLIVPWLTIVHATAEENHFQIDECINASNKEALKTTFACVRSFSSRGTKQQSCQTTITSQNQPAFTVYDFNAKTASWNNIKKVLQSFYLGDKLKYIHDSELDFGTPSTEVVGAIFYGYERNITWYLQTAREVPSSCSGNSHCVSSVTTTTGYARFSSNKIDKYTVHYICAVADDSEIKQNSSIEFLPRISACSDGFIIDDIPPFAGKITVENTNGFINVLPNVEVSWNSFRDNIDANLLGYKDSIHMYTVLLGTRSGGDDIQRHTLGEETSLTVQNLVLEDGTSVFVSVIATDYSGLSTQVTSKELVVDISPPKLGQIVIDSLTHSHWVSSNDVTAHLVGFHDAESGIDYFVAYIGSSQNIDDVMTSTKFESDTLDIALKETNIHDGHSYFLAVKAANRAGLSSDYVVMKFEIDKSPPIGGHVMDGLRSNQKDIDYQAGVDYISGHWIGFTDPHSGISHYRVGLGTGPYVDDIEPMTSTGLRTYVIWNSTFTPGVQYFMTVEACNGAAVCRSLSSDGVILDDSPPIPGLVRVGSLNSHQTYIPKNSSVEIFWTGFEDPQSGLDHFEACIGTLPGTCDVTPIFNCLLATSHIKTDLHMPENTDLYVTVTAYNNINMSVSRTSNYFLVDSSAPIISRKPVFSGNYTSNEDLSTQWEKSVLSISWKFIDPESPVIRHVVTLVTHHEGHTPVEHVEVGPADILTLSLNNKQWLHNGDTYKTLVTACNAAGLCTTAESNSLLIDSTPPHLGGFKSPMEYRNFVDSNGTIVSEVSLTWYGFHDQESDVMCFYIAVGKTYSGNELSDGLVRINASISATEYNAVITLKQPLSPNSKVVASIMAENYAGLLSSISRATLTPLAKTSTDDIQTSMGVLEIEKHSCDIHFCNKDCTCAVVGQPCAMIDTNMTCQVVNSSIDNPLNVIVHIYGGMSSQPINITASSSCLSANWVVEEGDFSIKRFEWSMGEKNYGPGEGIFEKNEIMWRDIGKFQSVVHCLPLNYSLVHGTEYIIYVRAWVDRDKYYSFKSSAIMVDQTPPDVRKGSFVKDSDTTCIFDYDIVDWLNEISACWNGVFIEPQGQITFYEIALGTNPGADDVVKQVNVGMNTSFHTKELHLSSGRRYFFTVTAHNNAGLHKTICSDGFLVDTEDPTAGVVYNTNRQTNNGFQPSTSTFDLSWHGFLDHDSGIKAYSAALVEESENNTFITNFINCGLRTDIKFTNLSLVHGRRYFGVVKAVDAANHESKLVYSNSKFIDATAPSAYGCGNETILYKRERSLSVSPRMSFSAALEPNEMYIVSGNVLMSDYYPFIRIMIDGESGHTVPIELLDDGTFHFHYTTLSDRKGNQTISIESDAPTAKIKELAFSKCTIILTGDPSESLHVKQISSKLIKASVRVFDKESAVKRILLGAGTLPGGLQHKAFYQIDSLSDEIFSISVSHGTPVYVTAIVENYSGLRATFYSKRLILDHTPPVIDNVSVEVADLNKDKNETHATGNTGLVQLKATWNASDDESGVKICLNYIGTSMYTDDVQQQGPASQTNVLLSEPIKVSHGRKLYVTVKCINDVELSTVHVAQPIIVSFSRPTVQSALVQFVPSSERQTPGQLFSSVDTFENRSKAIQSNRSTLQLTWRGFDDDSGFDHYEYRMSSSERVDDWTAIGTKTYATLNQLKLVDGLSYTAEIRAINRGLLQSDIVNTTIMVDSREPKLTGQAVEMSMSGRVAAVNWEHVFEHQTIIPSLFDVSIGSTPGFADIIDKQSYQSRQLSVSIPRKNFHGKNIEELFITIQCWYPTGMGAAYITRYTLPPDRNN